MKRYCPMLVMLIMPFTALKAYLPTEEETLANRQRLQERVAPHCISIPEGGFVYYFNPQVKIWLEQKFTLQIIQSIRQDLSSALTIPFSKEGFTAASTRRSEDDIDETNYSAIWVRDACWHYFGLKAGDRAGAKKLLLKLIEFYANPDQIKRLLNVIVTPSIVDPEVNPKAFMDAPLIRFSKKTLSHHQVKGVDQTWNHLQFDSHGLFLLTVADGLRSKLILPSDISSRGYEMLSLFPAFFQQTTYWQRKDAGPWEEEMLNNASTVGLIAAGLREYRKQLLDDPSIEKRLRKAIKSSSAPNKVKKGIEEIETLIERGVAHVELNLSLGGEAPNLSGNQLDRKADAALFSLCLPDHTLFFDDIEKIQTILNINLSLIGPYGVYRYKPDSYQALNYWITYKSPPRIEGSQSTDLAFIDRFEKGYAPKNQPYDAQWFFDSTIAGIYYHLSLISPERIQKNYYLHRGDAHLKRALGQLTEPNAIAANGEQLPAMCLPESINTVFTENYLFKPMPSPICPLSWSTAMMRIALEKAEQAHQSYETSH